FDFAGRGGEVAVPEVGHFFLQGPGSRQGLFEPPDFEPFDGLALLMPHHPPTLPALVFIQVLKLPSHLAKGIRLDQPIRFQNVIGNPLRVSEVMHGALEPHRFQFIDPRQRAAEPGSVEQMPGGRTIPLVLI
ncbi:MAG: hypothetical protein QGH15_22945, partial [Kiritimatiellia bacterium]|nr:hypothetical protein [Kiritimatiellia bacterium]